MIMFFQIIDLYQTGFVSTKEINANPNCVSGEPLTKKNVRKALSQMTSWHVIEPTACNANDTVVYHDYQEHQAPKIYLRASQIIVWDGLENKVLYKSARTVSVQDLILLSETEPLGENAEYKSYKSHHQGKGYHGYYSRPGRHIYRNRIAKEIYGIYDAIDEHPELYHHVVKLKCDRLYHEVIGDRWSHYVNCNRNWKNQSKVPRQWATP